jgi:hypothetical protein
MHMSHRPSRMKQPEITVAVGLCVLALMTACASDQPKPLPQPTPDQVRSHADRAFEKLKQEEQERAAQPPAPRY